MSPTRTFNACLQASMADLPSIAAREDERALMDARLHLERMGSRRRAMLEREWTDGERGADCLNEPIPQAIKDRAAKEWGALK